MWIFSAIANAVGRNFIGRPNYLFDLLFNRVQADGGVTEAQQCTINELTDLQNDNLLSSASLVLTPSSYKEGKLYSVIPENGDGDFTFTRATTATRVNSDGLVELVPYNLVRYSEQFNEGAWVKVNTTITANTTTAPNGTLTADKVIATNTAYTTRAAYQSFTPILNSIYTISVYVKAAEYTKFAICEIGYGRFAASFDLVNQTATVIGGLSYISSLITDVGNGWFRCSVTANGSTGGWAVAFVGYPDVGATLSTSGVSYAGDGTSGIYIWGAQAVEGTSARDYLRTETRLNIPRIDYSLGGCPNILLEPQRTNLITQSEYYGGSEWTKASVSITSNSIISPDGTLSGSLMTITGGVSDQRIYTNITYSGTNVVSIFAKASDSKWLSIRIGNNANKWYDLENGILGGSTLTSGYVDADIQDYGNGWYRCILVFTDNFNTSTRFYPAEGNLDITHTSGSVYIYGAQAEAGAYATSYIPTTTASVTRNSDVLTRNNIYTNGLISASGGTWFVELRGNRLLTRDANGGIWIGDNTAAGTSGNTLVFRNGGGTQRLAFGKTISGSFTSLFLTTTDTCKIAIKWNGTTADVFANGVKVVSATAFTTTNMEFLVGNGIDVPKYIQQMELFPTPLSDDQLEALTGEGFNTYAEMASYYNYTLQ